MKETRLVSPGTNGNITNEYGLIEKPPEGWIFLPSGDAALTRKVTDQGAYWRVQVKKGRRMQSLGLWAPKKHIESAKLMVAQMRADPSYAKKKESAAKSREKKQATYTLNFEHAVTDYLNFHLAYKKHEIVVARLVTKHAIPIGSGTVARTERISIEERASKAVIAWMRHETTNYDHRKIARIKGERRSVRRELAAASINLLKPYRQGKDISPDCPLLKVLLDNE